jgi:hypothetical protein
MIGYTEHLFTVTINYSDITKFHNSLGHAPFSFLCSQLLLSLSLTLRPTVSRPVCLGIKQQSGTYDQILITASSCGFGNVGRHGPHRKHSPLLPQLCNLATSCSMADREHSSQCCVFAGTCLLSRCLAMNTYCCHALKREGVYRAVA